MGEPGVKILGGGPLISRSHELHFMGDWGQANAHRVVSWLTQEFCDRAGSRSRVAVWSLRGGGMEALHMVNDGEADLAMAVPSLLMKQSLTGDGIFEGRKYPNLRALAVLPQDDRVVLGLDPKLGCKTWADIREKKPVLKLVIGPDTTDNATAWVSHRLLEAHGLSADIIRSWGGEIIDSFQRPDQCLIPAQDPNSGINAVVQEALMTPWWTLLIDGERQFIPIPAEPEALEKLKSKVALPPSIVPAGYWNSLKTDMPALSFSDFLVFVRDDLPDDVAYLLTWILVETKGMIESQFKHIPAHKSPLGYPFDPKKMATTPIPLHAAAERYYREHGYLN